MNPTTDIVEELRLYNRWRRGDEAITAPDPTALGKLLDDAADRIEHLFASGIHTCNADCQRPMCVLRRERDKAQNDLARVTAERQNWKEWAEEARAMFHKQIDAAAVMKTRAEQAEQRVAELEAQIERDAWTLSPEMVQTRNDQLAAKLEQAEQRNAELVAALRPIYALRKNCEGDIGWRGQKDAKVGWVTVRDILALEQALARAESATPAKGWLDRHAENFQQHISTEGSATPAKHPDTVRLDWLASNKQSGGKAFCLQWTFRDNNNQTNIRDAIDAARKQGGSAHD
jgi:hypothetical protein